MLVEIWGAGEKINASLPDHPLGYFLLIFYLFLIATFLYQIRHPLVSQLSDKGTWLAGLVFAALICSRLLPLQLPGLPTAIALFSALPLLLAAAILSPALAMIVGAATGLIVSLTVSHELYDIFHYALTALLAALLMQQPFAGRVYAYLRQPMVAGGVALATTAVLQSIATFINNLHNGSLMALDQAVVMLNQHLLVRTLEGVMGGALVWLILRWLPILVPKRSLISAPMQRSLSNQIMGNFLLFSLALTLLVLTITYNLSVLVSRQLVVNQMAQVATLTAHDVPEFYSQLQEVVAVLNENDTLINGTPAEQEAQLAQIQKDGSYQRLLVVNNNHQITYTYPDNVGASDLLPAETAVLETITAAPAAQVTTTGGQLDQIMSFIVPLLDSRGDMQGALIGRVPQLQVNDLIIGLEGDSGNGLGFIVNENERIIAHPDTNQLNQIWQPQANGRIPTSASIPNGGAYQAYAASGDSRQIVYYLRGTDPAWTVVMQTPYAAVLNLALSIGLPLAIFMLLITVGTASYLQLQTDQITQPLKKLVTASHTMTSGGNWSPDLLARRDDEIGELGLAFSQMQRAVKKQLGELSLLLAISQDVSNNLDLYQGMPTILRGALRGTGASGARAVVVNPSAGKPLMFGEGPSAQEMSRLDRAIMSKLRHRSELLLSTPEQVRTALDLPETADLPVPALLAIRLRFFDQFQGVLWLGYRQPQSIHLSERHLLNTLSGQAAVLVQNAHLFAKAEGGRRRLAAVLASTSDPVIVTDPTDRVLLINPAMEAILGLKGDEIKNRSVRGVIKMKALVAALTGKSDHLRNVEIATGDGRIFYGNASTIMGQNGQAFGRVAVLHDITHLKEIDKLKSEFVQTVSHDLKNPLTFISGYVAMMPMAGDLTAEQRTYLSKIENGIDQMTQLVTDLLDLGRIEAGVDITQNSLEVAPLLDSVVEDYWPHATQAGIQLAVEVEPNVGTVRGDGALLRQAITNLVSNAIKYAPQSDRIKLHAGRTNDQLVISVQDNGPGIPEKDQMRLFEKFYRVKQPGTERVKGSGLGLAIVKSIAERHGGRAGCYSHQGEGATFYISLPSQPSRNGANSHS